MSGQEIDLRIAELEGRETTPEEGRELGKLYSMREELRLAKQH